MFPPLTKTVRTYSRASQAGVHLHFSGGTYWLREQSLQYNIWWSSVVRKQKVMLFFFVNFIILERKALFIEVTILISYIYTFLPCWKYPMALFRGTSRPVRILKGYIWIKSLGTPALQARNSKFSNFPLNLACFASILAALVSIWHVFAGYKLNLVYFG